MSALIQKKWDVIVIGGGPAGMMAAARAGERGRSVLLLEKNSRLGKKLSITGGGRCNVTNNKPDVRTMLKSYKDSGKFLFSTFTQYGVRETIDWFADRGVRFVEENEGRLFPETKSAETICSTMQAEVESSGVTVLTRVSVQDVNYDENAAEFIVVTDSQVYSADACVVASGGTSHPETGSTGEGFGWLRSLGHTVNNSSFALVPLVLSDEWVKNVSGITLDKIKITLLVDGNKVLSQKGKLLFTHVGVSGPTILNMSSKVGELLEAGKVNLELDLFPEYNEKELRSKLNQLLQDSSNQKVRNALVDLIPKSLAKTVLELLKIDGETPSHSVRSEDRSKLVTFLKHVPLTVKNLLGADKAVISGGGVDLAEVDFRSMNSRIIPKLFLVGDVLDIDRPSGGYSLQLCWSTGYVAGSNT